jgi:hypothetical protein
MHNFIWSLFSRLRARHNYLVKCTVHTVSPHETYFTYLFVNTIPLHYKECLFDAHETPGGDVLSISGSINFHPSQIITPSSLAKEVVLGAWWVFLMKHMHACIGCYNFKRSALPNLLYKHIRPILLHNFGFTEM